MTYLMRQLREIQVARCDGTTCSVASKFFGEAIAIFNERISKLAEFEIDISRLLGMRNLSAFVGELYGASVIKAADGLFRKNPHQDGYPDLLVMDGKGRQAWNDLSARLRDKKPFSPFPAGGIEIKATVGSVPAPSWFQVRGQEKPDIGDRRIAFLRGYDWKAHHRGTNNLLGLLWDFENGVPCIAAVFYSASLQQKDWGGIIQPREGGGNTTSVSIMTRQGVRKMYDGWLYVRDAPEYRSFLDRYNGGTAFQADLASGRVEF
ncbi:MAG: hypothetical protein JNM65_08205 [Verrucomicrobiaceae bacterium]|nr:hypothetical protein [Verrucomicrobiaceae bacterium]